MFFVILIADCNTTQSQVYTLLLDLSNSYSLALCASSDSAQGFSHRINRPKLFAVLCFENSLVEITNMFEFNQEYLPLILTASQAVLYSIRIMAYHYLNYSLN